MAKFNVAIVGCGGMSAAWLNYITKREDTKVVALVDLYKPSAEARKKEYNLDDAQVFDKLTDALEKCSIDIVVDVTIPDAHCETAITAMKAGCNVFGEKPMAGNLADAVKMVETAEATGKEYFVMQNRRYIDFMIDFHNITASGEMGKMGSLSADFFIGAHFGGFRDAMDSPLILDMSIHTFDSARYISNADAVSVYCHEFNPSWSWYKGDASAICIFEMSNNSVFDYRGSWCAEGVGTTWEADWRAVYEKGTVVCRDNVLTKEKVISVEGSFVNDAEKSIVTPTPIVLTEHDGCIHDMFESLAAGKRAQTDCRDNIKSIAMVYAAIESSKTQKKVKITY